MDAETSISRRAFAKINLDLRISGVRPDGYHELRTTFQSVALADTLTFVHARGPLRISCDDPRCPTDRTNLVWRAAQRMWTAAHRRGEPRDLAVSIVKRIPLQAGLGGGSSDAAAALVALAALWRVAPGSGRLREIAADIGADFPYFLEGGAALGLDRGDRVRRLSDGPRAWVVLVIPRCGVSTREAFAWWDRDHRAGQPGPQRQVLQPIEARDANDLQAVVAKRHPVVLKLVAALERDGARQASLSGSGSAVFGLFTRKPLADRAARRLAARGRTVIVTRTIGRREYLRLAAK